MADLLISDADRDALVAAGLLLETLDGPVRLQLVASLTEVARLLHDARRAYSRIIVCGVPGVDTGSLRASLAVLQARGTKVLWFDSHDLLWTAEVREQFDQLGVEVKLPDPHRPETERTSGLVLAHLLDTDNAKARRHLGELRAAIAQVQTVDMGGPDWLTLVDAIQHDHRLVTNKLIRSAVTRVWEPDAPLTESERRLVAVQRSREAKVGRFLDSLAEKASFDEELLRFDAEEYKELRYVRARVYVEAARRRMRAEHAQARVQRGWTFACRDPYRAGLDIPVAFLERLFDLDVVVYGYPYRATVRVESGADVDERLMKVLESALEEARSGRSRRAASVAPEEEMEW